MLFVFTEEKIFLLSVHQTLNSYQKKVSHHYDKAVRGISSRVFALVGMVAAADNFFQVMESVGEKASNLPGSVRKLGKQLPLPCMFLLVS